MFPAETGSTPQAATLDLIPAPVWAAARTAERVLCNAAWTRLTGTQPSLSLDEWLAVIHPDDRAAAAGWKESWDGLPMYEAELRLSVTGMQYRRFLMHAQRYDGETAFWVGTLFDIENTRLAQEQTERVYQTLADELPQLVGLTATDGTITYLNRRSAEYTGIPYDQRGPASWREFVHPDDLPSLEAGWGNALRTGERFETMYRFRRKDGVYRWFLNQARPVRDESGKIVSWIGTAIDIDEHKRREDALRVTVEVNEIFAGTLDVELALQKVADAAVRQLLADWCGVYVYDAERDLQPVAIAHRDPGAVRAIREYLHRYPLRKDEIAYRVAATGNAERIGPITSDMYDAIEDPQRRALARSFEIGAVMYVPLAAGDERFGVFSLAISGPERVFDENDERLAAMIAQRAAVALGTAKLFRRQREVAQTLQNAFLPASLPARYGVEWDAAYVPATRDISVGGDWYDADQRSDGLFTFTVGDVAGHGLDAAVPMGKMRQTFRVLGGFENDPAKMLQMADGILRREHPDVFVTAIVGSYDPIDGTLRYANAGHPRPFVRNQDGEIRRLGAPGPPLGLIEHDPPLTLRDLLASGDLLVMFTDGLIEMTRDIAEAEDQLQRLLEHPAFGVCSNPAALLRALMIQTAPRDDIAILTLRTGRSANWTFDANDAHVASDVRRQFVALLHRWGVPESAIGTQELVFGEIIANKVRHASGIVDAAVTRHDDPIVLRIVDRGPNFEWQPRRPSDHSEGGRGLYLIDSLSEEVRYEELRGFGTYLEVRLRY